MYCTSCPLATEKGGASGCVAVILGPCAESSAEPAVMTAVPACTAEFSIFNWNLTQKLYRHANRIRCQQNLDIISFGAALETLVLSC